MWSEVASLAVDLTIRGAGKLRDVARALREADRKDLERGLRKAIREAAKPTLEAIQRSARDIKTQGVRKPGAKRPFVDVFDAKGTRKRIADAVVADVRTTGEDPRVRFRVAESKLAPDIKQMPRKFDEGKFRHPVMGNRDVWVSQTSDPWFWPPIQRHIKDFRAEIDKAIEVVKEKIEHS
jgi:hypothetical protein